MHESIDCMNLYAARHVLNDFIRFTKKLSRIDFACCLDNFQVSMVTLAKIGLVLELTCENWMSAKHWK